VIRAFKSFTPQTIITLLLFTIVIKLGYLLYPIDYHTYISQNNLTAWGLQIHQFSLENISLSNILACIIICFQALFINRLSTEYKLFPQDTFIPAALYILISSCSPWFNILTPELLASSCILLIINNILRIQITTMPKKLMYNSGLLLGLATLIYWPSILFILFILWAYSISKKFEIKEIIALIFGTATTIYLYMAYLFLLDKPSQLTEIFENKNFSISFDKIKNNWLPITCIALTTLTATYGLNKNYERSLESQKKMWISLIIYLIISILFTFADWQNNIINSIFLLPSATLILAHVWLTEYNKWIRILLFWVIIGCTVYFQYFK